MWKTIKTKVGKAGVVEAERRRKARREEANRRRRKEKTKEEENNKGEKSGRRMKDLEWKKESSKIRERSQEIWRPI